MEMNSEQGRMNNFIEEIILDAVKALLLGEVNELLEGMEYPVPPVEVGQSGFTGLSPEFRQGRNSTLPVISLSACERSEKERIVRIDAYTLTVAFAVPEHPDGERNCYAYAASVAAALRENPTLGGAVGLAELAGKKYTPPKQGGTGGEWGVVLSLRVTVENE
jgi:hypothetical protein